MFVATANLWRMGSRQLDGPADLVVEVISDDSVARDRDEKFFEYQQAGVHEYWIIDPRPGRMRADFYVLDAQGRYQAVPLGADNIYHSTVLPNFWLNTDWLWQEEADSLAVFGQIVGIEKVIAALQQDG
jgi:Uma2 family endonuclease